MKRVPAIYQPMTPAILGYDVAFQVLQNPTGANWRDWVNGSTENDEAKAAFGRALVAYFGPTTDIEGVDFSTPEAAIATITNDDLPDDVLRWLIALPAHLWKERQALIRKNLSGSSINEAES